MVANRNAKWSFERIATRPRRVLSKIRRIKDIPGLELPSRGFADQGRLAIRLKPATWTANLEHVLSNNFSRCQSNFHPQALTQGLPVHYLPLREPTNRSSVQRCLDLPYPLYHGGKLARKETHAVVVPFHIAVEREVLFNDVRPQSDGRHSNIDSTIMARIANRTLPQVAQLTHVA